MVKRAYALFLVALVSVLVCLPPQQTEAQLPVTLVVESRIVYPDVPPQIVNGRVMVPLRFVAEALGMEVSWDNATRTVWVKRPAAPLKEPEVIGSELFVKETREALRRLQDDYPAGYHLVCTAFRTIRETDFFGDEPIAGVSISRPEVCHFNVRLGSIPTSERAAYLCHEAAHSWIGRTPIRQAVTNKDSEALAYLVAYRAAKTLNDAQLSRGLQEAVKEHLFH